MTPPSSDHDVGGDPMDGALCRSLPSSWWVEPQSKPAARQAAALCLTSCEVLDECRKQCRWHKPFDRPYEIVQAGEVWPLLADSRIANVPNWWPEDEQP